MSKQAVRINIQASAKDRKTLQEVLKKIADEVYQATSSGSYGQQTPKKEQAYSGQLRTDDKSYRYRLQEKKDEPVTAAK